MNVQIDGVTYVPEFTPPKIKGDLQKVLITARRYSGETLQVAANGIGISKTHLWELESGSSCNPTHKVLISMVKHYGITPDNILGF